MHSYRCEVAGKPEAYSTHNKKKEVRRPARKHKMKQQGAWDREVGDVRYQGSGVVAKQPGEGEDVSGARGVWNHRSHEKRENERRREKIELLSPARGAHSCETLPRERLVCVCLCVCTCGYYLHDRAETTLFIL